MASRGFHLLRLKPLAPTSTSALHLRAALPVLRSSPLASIWRRPAPSLCRPFSHSWPRARQRDPRPHDPPKYDYDPALGDPWYHHRLRTAKPLFGGRSLGQIIRSRRTRLVILSCAVLAGLFYWSHLDVVSVSGRSRFNCFSEKTVEKICEQEYYWLLREMEHKGRRFLPDHDWRSRMAHRVMARLLPVAAAGAPHETREADAREWEVHVIEDENPTHANAFVLPGRRVFIFSSLLHFARTDDQLAAVLSHEIAHNLAQHIGERLSQAATVNFFLGSALLLFAASPFRFITGGLLGGSALSLLYTKPMSRVQESEADYIGLMMMAEACYDPRQSITFWQRMDNMTKRLGQEENEFTSTHPSNEHRIENIMRWLPQAMEKRQMSDCRGTQGFVEIFRRAMERGEILAIRM